jgi:hypothetical protein
MSERTYELGLDSFLAVTADGNGQPIPGDQVIRNAVEEGVLAEQVGIIPSTSASTIATT